MGAALKKTLDQPPQVVFSDRCLINLASLDEQVEAIRRIVSVLAPGGVFLMLENSLQTHAQLNVIRQSIGLEARPAATYNVFIDEEALGANLGQSVELLQVRDFSALHDLMLYAAQAKSCDWQGHLRHGTHEGGNRVVDRAP